MSTLVHSHILIYHFSYNLFGVHASYNSTPENKKKLTLQLSPMIILEPKLEENRKPSYIIYNTTTARPAANTKPRIVPFFASATPAALP